ncbi:hypothetical protein C1645_492282 [Glomus cerebriforme]|uniref:Uncharacterized protein n=1 Tax=Glomus cerebriforme TaxID=658196 RepID=A0A397S8X6_9GLOM|nr:hypothetical protein C1645_492282 [Glomus cerebriforme]
MCGVMYLNFIGISLLSRIMSQYIKYPENKIEMEDFIQSFMYVLFLTVIKRVFRIDRNTNYLFFLYYSGMLLFLIFAKSDSPTIFLPSFYYGSPEKLIFKSESYFRGDSFLFARPPSLTSTFREMNPPNTMKQVTPPNIMRQATLPTTMKQVLLPTTTKQVTIPNTIRQVNSVKFPTMLSTISEEEITIEVDQDNEVTEIEEIV